MIKNTQGFIALTAVLILSAIFLSLAINAASHVVSVSDTGIAFYERDTARYQARGCIEYARLQLQRVLDYQGNEVILIGDGECEILTIEGSGNADRVLRVKSSVGRHTIFTEDIIKQISPNLVVTSSKRVEQF